MQTAFSAVSFDVAHAEFCHRSVSSFHFEHCPPQGAEGFLGLCDDGGEQVGDILVCGELEHFGIDEDEPAILRRVSVEEREDHSVDADRLACPCRSCDEKVRHIGEVGDLGCAVAGFAERERQKERRRGGFQQLFENNGLALFVGQFDADSVLAGDDGDAHRDASHGASDVFSEADNARRFNAGRGFQRIERDDRTALDVGDGAAHAVVGECFFESLRGFVQFFL